MKYKPKPKSWFMKRIGKRIYSDDIKCCSQCSKNYKNGLIVSDERHADYLSMIDHHFAFEGIYFNYRDKK
jgi:hypothetical protein